jgi:hypothetical protein
VKKLNIIALSERNSKAATAATTSTLLRLRMSLAVHLSTATHCGDVDTSIVLNATHRVALLSDMHSRVRGGTAV